MAAIRNRVEPKKPRRPPASTPEGRENQLIALSVDLAEQQLREGTASAQVITHYLKLGTTRERLEQKKISLENELLKARTEAIASTQEIGELYANAIKAFATYSGHEVKEDHED